jgi:AhpD family alkylhydroperoxidase
MNEKEILDQRDKHLVFLAASVGSGCRPCTKYHVNQSLGEGFSEDEIKKVLTLAISVRDTATRKFEAFAFNGFSEADTKTETLVNADRSEIIICLAASYCINCNPVFQRYLTLARKTGIGEEAISEILRFSGAVSEKARSLLVV